MPSRCVCGGWHGPAKGGAVFSEVVTCRRGKVLQTSFRRRSLRAWDTLNTCKAVPVPLFPHRFFSVTPTPAPSMSRKLVSRSGLVVIASMYRGSGGG